MVISAPSYSGVVNGLTPPTLITGSEFSISKSTDSSKQENNSERSCNESWSLDYHRMIWDLPLSLTFSFHLLVFQIYCVILSTLHRVSSNKRSKIKISWGSMPPNPPSLPQLSLLADILYCSILFLARNGNLTTTSVKVLIRQLFTWRLSMFRVQDYLQ